MKRENHNRQMQSLWQIKPPASREKRHGKHPTQKPEALLDRIIRASTNPHDLILDPFCGSGTTGTVCARLGRRFVGIDLIISYLEIAATRLQDEITSSQQLELTFSRVSVETIWVATTTQETSSFPTWAEIVSIALKELGGEAHLKEINRIVEKSSRTKENVTWASTIRRVVRQSERFESLGQGRYKLRHLTTETTENY